MKNRNPFPLLLCAIAALASPALAAPGWHLPLKPAELIACLPAAPPGWTMTGSRAADQFSGSRITTHAQRDFKRNPPPAAREKEEPATMNVYLTDTGSGGDFKAMFTPPASGPASGAAYFKLRQFPARLLKGDGKTVTLDLLVDGRFLVEIRAKNLSADKLRSYGESLNFQKFSAIPDSGETRPTNPVILSRVDEMNPKNNRSYPLYWQRAKPEP